MAKLKLQAKTTAYWFWLLLAITNVEELKHWLTNAMLHATNAMLHTTNAMLPATNAMLPATNAMLPATNAMLRFNFNFLNQC